MSENAARRAILKGIINKAGARIRMSGIMGASMSSLALMLREGGVAVSGADDAMGAEAQFLTEAGVVLGREDVPADALVYSYAIPESHPERSRARSLGIPEFSRAELLGALMTEYDRRIGISGTHGKSTVTAMLASIMSCAGKEPTVLCGARMAGGGRYVGGGRKYLVYEACEYRDSFLHFSPTCAIITNVELDHTDYFKSPDELRRSFVRSAEGAELAVVGIDSPMGAEVASELGRRAIRVGRGEGADYRVHTLCKDAGGSLFAISRGGEILLRSRLGAVGEYNVDNAAIAAVTALLHGIGKDDISSSLERFSGIGMRLEKICELAGRSVYRDYAHHPTEIAAVIATLRDIYGSVAVLFRPHTYTRTRDLWAGFTKELSLADEVGIYDIYPAREEPIPGIGARELAADIRGASALSESDALEFILSARSSAIVLMGAGDLCAVEREISGLSDKGDSL